MSDSIYAYGRRLDELDIRRVFATYGDDEVTRYDRGEIPRDEAVEMARNYYRQLAELDYARPLSQREEK